MINGINLLFPVLNEHLRLENGIEKAHAYCEENLSVPYKMTIIDNGSADDTPEIAKHLAEKYKEVEYVAVEYPPTSEIMAKLDELELEIGNEMEVLRSLLGL